jgi:hypothetical protein
VCVCWRRASRRGGESGWAAAAASSQSRFLAAARKKHENGICAVLCGGRAAVRRVEVDRGQKLRPAQIKTMSKVRV